MGRFWLFFTVNLMDTTVNLNDDFFDIFYINFVTDFFFKRFIILNFQ
jgi:hypothetical protein